MPNEEESVNDETFAEPQPNEEGVNTQVADETEGEQISDKEFNFRELSSKLESEQQTSKQKDDLIKTLYGQLQQGQQSQQQQPPAKQDVLESLFEGKEGFESFTVDEAKKFAEAINSKISGAVKNVERKTVHQSMSDRHGDYVSLINKYEKEVPSSIARAIEVSGDLEAAIEACKTTKAYQRDNAEKNIHPDATRALNNADRPKSSAGVGAGGTVSKFTKFLNQTRAERVAEARKIARGA